MATVTKLITVEEFAEMPDPADGSTMELVNGEIVIMPRPKALHGICCSKIDRRVGNFIEQQDLGTTASNDAGCILSRDPDTVRGPDFAYWSCQRLPEEPEGYFPTPPDLVVEVISPSDTYSEVNAKAVMYLRSGVFMVWLVDPATRTLTIRRPRQQPLILEADDELQVEDLLPGFSCRVSDLLPKPIAE